MGSSLAPEAAAGIRTASVSQVFFSHHFQSSFTKASFISLCNNLKEMAPTCAVLTILCIAMVVGNKYDNSQHGQENYIVDMEDVLVVAIQDPENYDTDYYDYSDLTVKPEEELLKPPSPPMSTSTQATIIATTPSSKPNSTSATASGTASPNVTLVPVKEVVTSANPHLPLEASHQHPLNTENGQIPVVVVTDPLRKKGYISSSSIRKKNQNTPAVDLESLPKRTCAPGFVLDEKNRCKKNRGGLLARQRIPLPYGLHYAQRPHVGTAQVPSNS